MSVSNSSSTRKRACASLAAAVPLCVTGAVATCCGGNLPCMCTMKALRWCWCWPVLVGLFPPWSVPVVPVSLPVNFFTGRKCMSMCLLPNAMYRTCVPKRFSTCKLDWQPLRFGCMDQEVAPLRTRLQGSPACTTALLGSPRLQYKCSIR